MSESINDLINELGGEKVVETLLSDNQIRINYRCAADIQAKPINWLWHEKIALGKISMLAGNPGLGKSQITASLAAITTTGGKFPLTPEQCTPGNVLILSAEDDAADTIKPRLEAAGANSERVFIIDAVKDHDHEGLPINRSFNLKQDIENLQNVFYEIGNVSLIIIDPISAYLGGTDTHKNGEVRQALEPLSKLAANHSCAVVCVSHLNKGGNNDAMARVTGSLAFVAAARAAFLVAKDPNNEDQRLFLPMKNNIGNDTEGLSFHIESFTLNNDIKTSRVIWDAKPVLTKANEVLANHDDSERSATDEAVEFLQDILQYGPVKAADIFKEAKQAGITEKPLRNAKARLKIKAEKAGFSDGWRWSLPSENLSKMTSNTEDDQDDTSQKQVILVGKGHLGADDDDFVEVSIQ